MNLTEVFHNFCFWVPEMGGRCLMNVPGDTNVLKAEKMTFTTITTGFIEYAISSTKGIEWSYL